MSSPTSFLVFFGLVVTVSAGSGIIPVEGELSMYYNYLQIACNFTMTRDQRLDLIRDVMEALEPERPSKEIISRSFLALGLQVEETFLERYGEQNSLFACAEFQTARNQYKMFGKEEQLFEKLDRHYLKKEV